MTRRDHEQKQTGGVKEKIINDNAHKHHDLVRTTHAIPFNYFLVPERYARKSHRLRYTYKTKQKLSNNNNNHKESPWDIHHRIYTTSSKQKRYTGWERSAKANGIHVYQNIGTLIILV